MYDILIYVLKAWTQKQDSQRCCRQGRNRWEVCCRVPLHVFETLKNTLNFVIISVRYMFEVLHNTHEENSIGTECVKISPRT